MFDLAYIAANTGAEFKGKGDIFKQETVTANGSGDITLTYEPVTVNPESGENKVVEVFARKQEDLTGRMMKFNDTEGKTVHLGAAYSNATVCVLYRYTNNFAESIEISSQFIPKTLHAVLTVALYAGDNCGDVEQSTKIGEVVIDVPRFQLSGSMDLTMNSTGAAQSNLEGQALASGCQGCDGDAIYATITRVIYDNTPDKVDSIIIEDGNFTLKPGVKKELKVYAYFKDGSLIPLDAGDMNFSSATEAAATVSTRGVVTAVASGSSVITAATNSAKLGVSASGTVTVTVSA